ncbi:MAG: DUF3575 domain-containing protein [Chloroflexota bacterium]
MKSRLALLLPAILLLINTTSTAQEMNFVKTNFLSLLTLNPSLTYERILAEKVSASLTFSMMPAKGIPFRGIISNSMESTNEDIDFDIDNFRFSAWSVTPDVRFYLGEGYGKGFYIAPYFKHSTFKIHEFNVDYTNSENEINKIALSGKFQTNAGGVMFGAQWPLGDYLCLDWWILGFHGGRSKTTIVGDPSIDLTPAEQDDIKQGFEDIDLPMFNMDSSVSADKVSVTSKSPWMSVRGGLSLGIRF